MDCYIHNYYQGVPEIQIKLSSGNRSVFKCCFWFVVVFFFNGKTKTKRKLTWPFKYYSSDLQLVLFEQIITACSELNYSPTCLYCSYCDHEIKKKKEITDNDMLLLKQICIVLEQMAILTLSKKNCLLELILNSVSNPEV